MKPCKITIVKRKTHDEVRLVFNNNGFTLLGDYINSRVPIKCKCKNGHETYKSYDNVRKNNGCKACVSEQLHRDRVIDFKSVVDEFKVRGYEVLSDKKDYKNSHSKIKFKCSTGHVNYIRITNFRQGRGCKECGVKRKEFHWKWNDSLTDHERINGRDSVKTRDWRNAVFAKNSYTCQKCDTRSGNGKSITLNAHHIENYSSNKKKRYIISNGITLCEVCHKAFHGTYGKKDNNIEQLIEFQTCIGTGFGSAELISSGTSLIS